MRNPRLRSPHQREAAQVLRRRRTADHATPTLPASSEQCTPRSSPDHSSPALGAPGHRYVNLRPARQSPKASHFSNKFGEVIPTARHSTAHPDEAAEVGSARPRVGAFRRHHVPAGGVGATFTAGKYRNRRDLVRGCPMNDCPDAAE